jgi:hypothetical protein
MHDLRVIFFTSGNAKIACGDFECCWLSGNGENEEIFIERVLRKASDLFPAHSITVYGDAYVRRAAFWLGVRESFPLPVARPSTQRKAARRGAGGAGCEFRLGVRG